MLLNLIKAKKNQIQPPKTTFLYPLGLTKAVESLSFTNADAGEVLSEASSPSKSLKWPPFETKALWREYIKYVILM